MPWRWTGTPKTATSTGRTSPPIPSTERCGTAPSRRSVTEMSSQIPAFLFPPAPGRGTAGFEIQVMLPSTGADVEVQELNVDVLSEVAL